jgi:hypothetical protein
VSFVFVYNFCSDKYLVYMHDFCVRCAWKHMLVMKSISVRFHENSCSSSLFVIYRQPFHRFYTFSITVKVYFDCAEK